MRFGKSRNGSSQEELQVETKLLWDGASGVATNLIESQKKKGNGK